MVKEQDIDELEELLEIFKRIVRRLTALNKMNWKVQINVPLTNEQITHTILEAKKQEIIQDAISKRNTLKTKIDSIDWTSLN